MAAEMPPIVRCVEDAVDRFNEAAANGRGNQADFIRALFGRGRFNEAAANGRGNWRNHLRLGW